MNSRCYKCGKVLGSGDAFGICQECKNKDTAQTVSNTNYLITQCSSCKKQTELSSMFPSISLKDAMGIPFYVCKECHEKETKPMHQEEVKKYVKLANGKIINTRFRETHKDMFGDRYMKIGNTLYWGHANYNEVAEWTPQGEIAEESDTL